MEPISNLQNNFLEEKLFKSRTVMIVGQIDDDMAKQTSERLMALAGESNEPINVFISSPGGHVESGDMIHDVIKFIEPKVRTIGSGWVASAGALIFVAAEKKDRFCLPNTRFLLHQPSGGTEGRAGNIAIQAQQIVQMRDRLNKIFAEATGQPLKKIVEDTDHDFWLTAEEAIKYGLVGKIIKSSKDIS